MRRGPWSALVLAGVVALASPACFIARVAQGPGEGGPPVARDVIREELADGAMRARDAVVIAGGERPRGSWAYAAYVPGEADGVGEVCDWLLTVTPSPDGSGWGGGGSGSCLPAEDIVGRVNWQVSGGTFEGLVTAVTGLDILTVVFTSSEGGQFEVPTVAVPGYGGRYLVLDAPEGFGIEAVVGLDEDGAAVCGPDEDAPHRCDHFPDGPEAPARGEPPRPSGATPAEPRPSGAGG